MLDYKKIGLKVGLEIHQQLDSGTKLFCRCPIKRSENFPEETRRRLRAVAGEMGITDKAALYEQTKSKLFVYKYNTESSCLVELDEQPPVGPNLKALEIAIQVCKLLECDIVDELHCMRKTLIDGSAVSGFQRTAFIGSKGKVRTNEGVVGITGVMLEEDSGTPSARSTEHVEYKIDRLGIPLVEIATDASICSPEQAQETAENIGLLLRSLSVVRGIGSIRQDVNVSIAQGARVEIKGFQELEKISNAVDNEVKRQMALIEIKEDLIKKGFKAQDIKAEDATDFFKDTKSNAIRKIVGENGRVFAAKLSKFKGLLKKQTGDRTFGKELSAYAAAHGYGIIHSDEDLEKYYLVNEFGILKKHLKAGEEDAIFITAGAKRNDAGGIGALEKAAHAVIQRANYCIIGVPEETRMADGFGSKYMRPLPGAGRLYPESDIQPVFLRDMAEKIKTPKTLLEKKKEMNLPEELADQIIRSKYLPWYEELSRFGETLVASTLLNTFKELSRRGLDITRIRKEDLSYLFTEVINRKVSKDSVSLILERYILSGSELRNIIKEFELMDENEIKAVIRKIIDKNHNANEGALMGIAMKELRGKADGERVMKLIREMKS
ncbi:MAG TPA: Glu-tRNA(Gln) amidotransferase subunit GatE [archaeon]|nr:Glu-tRNA(Gln) amidotransferase subunit GatE [archaeon]